jgi:hypothetical protein
MGLIGFLLPIDMHLADGRVIETIRDATRGLADGPEPVELPALIKAFCCDCCSFSNFVSIPSSSS